MIALIQDVPAKGKWSGGKRQSVLYFRKVAGFAGLSHAQGTILVGEQLQEAG
jgi:hypothetical protein